MSRITMEYPDDLLVALGSTAEQFEQRTGTLTRLTFDYRFEDLRSDPRYANLVRRMGLEP